MFSFFVATVCTTFGGVALVVGVDGDGGSGGWMGSGSGR